MVRRPVNTLGPETDLLNTSVGSATATGGRVPLTRDELAAPTVQWLATHKGSRMTG